MCWLGAAGHHQTRQPLSMRLYSESDCFRKKGQVRIGSCSLKVFCEHKGLKDDTGSYSRRDICDVGELCERARDIGS